MPTAEAQVESVSDKNLSALRILNDPLYKAPDPHETLQSLQEAVQAADGFVVPALSLAVPGGAPVATPKAERRIGPWLHRGLSQRPIDEALYRIRTENPGPGHGASDRRVVTALSATFH